MNMRAISPVIATVIIVSVAIAIAVAVAFWMTGITGLFTRYEKLEVISAYATKTDNNWNVVLIVENTGTSDATIDDIFINGKPLSAYGGNDPASPTEENEITLTLGDNILPQEGLSVPTGSKWTITIVVQANVGDTTFRSGQIIEVKLHTAAGNEYPKSVQLP